MLPAPQSGLALSLDMTGTARSTDRGGRVAVQSMTAAPASVAQRCVIGQTTKRPGGSGRPFPIRFEGPAGCFLSISLSQREREMEFLSLRERLGEGFRASRARIDRDVAGL